MKQVISLTILFAILVAVLAGGPPSDEGMRLLNECKSMEKASDEDIQVFLQHKIPTGPNAKCFLACVHERSGIVKDGKVNEDLLKVPPMRDGTKGPTPEALQECVAISSPDRCELASKLSECLQKVGHLSNKKTQMYRAFYETL